MKKTKNIFSVLSIFILALCSCSNDTDESIKLIKKLVTTSADGVAATTLFTYDGNKIVSVDGVQKHTDYTYTDDLITKKVTLNKTNQLEETIEYSYMEGKLIEVISLGNYRINYIHNSDKTVSYGRFTIVSANQQVKEFHGTLYFDNENLIKDERVLDNTAASVTSNYSISFHYDSKNNPLYKISGYKKLLNYNEVISSNNSLVSVVITSVFKDGQISSSAILYKSSYTYDIESYPKERVSETAIFDNGNTGYLKTQYFYSGKYLFLGQSFHILKL